MLILPELTATTSSPVEVDSITKGYMTNPTPGNSNSGLVAPLGPFIRNVTEDPIQPGDSDALVITAKVTETFDPVTGVTLHYRVKYGNEVSVQMYDDGTHGDGAAGDSVYGATIPASASSPGQMLRWYVTSDDDQQQTSRNPLYPWPDDSPQYYGTVIKDLSLTTQLPVFWWSTENVTNSRNRTGARASVFYNGHFYDNIYVRARGGWSAAGSQKFDFNRGFGIYVNETLGRVGEININVKGADPSYIRPVLGFFIHEVAGNPGSYSFLTHMRLNGNFDRVGIAIEQIDEDYLKRHGLNEFGSLYKFVARADGSSIPGLWDANSGAEPKLDTTDLSELVDMTAILRNIYKTGDPDTRLTTRRAYIFDNINIPEMVNYMAIRAIVEHSDDMRKNFYLARDLGASDEWSFLPWDLDWSLGSVTVHLPPPPGQSSTLYMHPFFCDSDHKLNPSPWGEQWNLLYDIVLDTPEFKEMMLRRLRTLMDAYLQPPDTPVAERYLDQKIDEIFAAAQADISSAASAVQSLKNHIQGRRDDLYNKHTVSGSHPESYRANIPDAQPFGSVINFGNYDYSPASYDQDHEYIELVNPNAYAVDISDWTLSGGVEHTFDAGTVIPAGGSLFVSPNVRAFRQRLISPTGGEAKFIQGNYKGHLSSWGETLYLHNSEGIQVNSMTYAGNPSDQQRYLRITELMYHPATKAGDTYNEEEYEYIELKNIGASALLLDGIKFTDGVYYDLNTHVTGLFLAADEYLLIVKNQAAFAERYNTAGLNVAPGEYTGYLSNGGENVKLKDETNSTILGFDYSDGWYDITDGGGFSLVIKDETNIDLDSWDSKSSWRPSAATGGSPGTDDSGQVPALGSVIINEVLAHSHAAEPDWIELRNTTGDEINIGGWFLSDNSSDDPNIMKYEIPLGRTIPANDYLVFKQDTSFGDPNDPGCHVPFALSEAGETVYLHSGQGGAVTGYVEEENFDASETGVTFGRYEKAELSGGYDFTRMVSPTQGGNNSGPLIPDVVITEIYYNPIEGADYEFVELYNRSDATITLMKDVTTETSPGVFITESIPWRLEGTGFEFPADTEIEAGEHIIVAKNPAVYDSLTCDVYGPYDGKLDNGGEQIEIQISGDLEYGQLRYWIPTEKIDYDDVAPWPTSSDESGDSLRRINVNIYGRDYSNWQAGTPDPGQ
jgi:hypothetical protein